MHHPSLPLGSYRGGNSPLLLLPVSQPDDGGGWLGAACPAGEVVGRPCPQQDLGGSINHGVFRGDWEERAGSMWVPLNSPPGASTRPTPAAYVQPQAQQEDEAGGSMLPRAWIPLPDSCVGPAAPQPQAR